jgi:hypothetical protein
VNGEWIKLQTEKLNGLCSLLNIALEIKLRRIGWVVHVACMEGEVYTWLWWGT